MELLDAGLIVRGKANLSVRHIPLLLSLLHLKALD